MEPGFAARIAVAAARVKSYVIFAYSASVMPAADTPRQKKHASYPASSAETPVKSVKSAWTSSFSLASAVPVGWRTTDRTASTSGASRHSRRTP